MQYSAARAVHSTTLYFDISVETKTTSDRDCVMKKPRHHTLQLLEFILYLNVYTIVVIPFCMFYQFMLYSLSPLCFLSENSIFNIFTIGPHLSAGCSKFLNQNRETSVMYVLYISMVVWKDKVQRWTSSYIHSSRISLFLVYSSYIRIIEKIRNQMSKRML